MRLADFTYLFIFVVFYCAFIFQNSFVFFADQNAEVLEKYFTTEILVESG